MAWHRWPGWRRARRCSPVPHCAPIRAAAPSLGFNHRRGRVDDAGRRPVPRRAVRGDTCDHDRRRPGLGVAVAGAGGVWSGRVLQQRPPRQPRPTERDDNSARSAAPSDRPMGADVTVGHTDGQDRLPGRLIRDRVMVAVGQTGQHVVVEADPDDVRWHPARHTHPRRLRLVPSPHRRPRCRTHGVRRLRDDAAHVARHQDPRRNHQRPWTVGRSPQRSTRPPTRDQPSTGSRRRTKPVTGTARCHGCGLLRRGRRSSQVRGRRPADRVGRCRLRRCAGSTT